MNRIALIIDGYSMYWSSVMIPLAAAVAVCVFLALYLRENDSVGPAAAVIPLAIILSLALARFLHWYCRREVYPDLSAAMTNLSSGGYALMGVFAGCALAAALVRLLRLTDNLPRLLDCMSIAGAAGIAVGRLASFFDTSDRGLLVSAQLPFPWSYTVVNQVTGAEETRLATFVIQALVTALIFLLLMALDTEERRLGMERDGDVCLLFLLCYGASQVILDSTRYDSLFFRSNGFVSVVQVLGALGIGLAVIVFSVRLVRSHGWKNWYIALWVVTAAFFGLGGYMEYYVQRHAAQAAFAYMVMGVALLGLIFMGMLIRYLANSHRLHRK